MQVKKRRIKGHLLIELAGDMDAYEAEDFESDILKAVEKGDTSVIVDFDKLEYISSSGLRALLNLRSRLEEKSGRLVLVSIKGSVLGVFRTSKLIDIFRVAKDVNEAIG